MQFRVLNSITKISLKIISWHWKSNVKAERFKAFRLYNVFGDFSHGIVTKTIFDSLLTRFAPFHLNEFRTYLKASKFSRILDSKRQNSAHYLNLLWFQLNFKDLNDWNRHCIPEIAGHPEKISPIIVYKHKHPFNCDLEIFWILENPDRMQFLSCDLFWP